MQIKVIVNPNSGRKAGGKRGVQGQLEQIIGRLLLEGVADSVSVTRTEYRGHAQETAAALTPGQYDLLIGCGGDGTINEIINGLMQGSSHTPLAILAAGTSNDFATSLGLPRTAEAFVKMVRSGRYQDIDIGRANDRYFINVASFGMFTAIAHNTDQQQKNALGMMAYYMKGVLDAPLELRNSFSLQFDSAEASGSGEYHVCLVSNSRSVGSIRNLMNQADVSDGLFDVMMLKKKRLIDQLPGKDPLSNVILDLDMLKRTFPYASQALSDVCSGQEEDPLLIYFQTRHIEFSSPDGKQVVTDLDGESFGTLPLTIDVAHKAIRLLVPTDEDFNPLRMTPPGPTNILLRPQPPRASAKAAPPPAADED